MPETFGQALRRIRRAAGFSQTALAQRSHLGQSDISRYERDRQTPSEATAHILDRATGAGGDLAPLASTTNTPAGRCTTSNLDDEMAALELARRVDASDVGTETLRRLDEGFHELATAYPTATPEQLLPRTRDRLGYVQHLLNAPRLNLAAHRHLVTLGGWYALLTATVLIDQERHAAATEYLRTADRLAIHAGHAEIRAWCLETEAWRQVTAGSTQRAVQLSQHAQHLAPTGSSVAIQATAQEGRAQARLGRASQTHRTVEMVHNLADGMERRHEAEHHYQYDTGKLASYTATTLAWLGDPEGVRAARAVVDRFRPSTTGQPWPRRYALGHVDLALGAARQGEHEQAVESVRIALHSGAVVPSNYWRVAEVVRELSAARVPASAELQQFYRALTHGAP